MNALTPREQLATVLAHIGVTRGRDDARKAGVSVMQLANAIMARPVSTVAYLRLCIAYGFDPLPDLPRPLVVGPADFDPTMLAIGFRIIRHNNAHSVRDAGKHLGVSAFTISRIENAHVMSIGVVLRACRYIGAHPYRYVHNHFGSTGNRHSNRLNAEKKRAEATA